MRQHCWILFHSSNTLLEIVQLISEMNYHLTRRKILQKSSLSVLKTIRGTKTAESSLSSLSTRVKYKTGSCGSQIIFSKEKLINMKRLCCRESSSFLLVQVNAHFLHKEVQNTLVS